MHRCIKCGQITDKGPSLPLVYTKVNQIKDEKAQNATSMCPKVTRLDMKELRMPLLSVQR